MLCVVLLGAACSSGSSGGAAGGRRDTTTTTTTTTPPQTPSTFAAAPCPLAIPADSGVKVDCGYLSVPENRLVANSRTIKLAVARIHSRSATPLEPVVELGGGPGYPDVERLPNLVKSKLLDHHDYIVWDQRGVGFSTPNLDCTETNEATWEMFRTTDDPKVEGDRLDASIRACRDRLVAQGVDLNGYNTIQVTADLNDLRKGLGIKSWNLDGSSYGTSVALEALREHQSGLHSVLLDSVVVPDQPFGAIDRGQSAQRAFDTVYKACDAEPACHDKYGDLRVLVGQVQKSLDDNPYRATITDPTDGRQRQIALTGQDFTAGLFTALYDPTLIPAVPSVLKSIAGGDRSIIATLATTSIPFAAGAAEGMTTSVNCADRGRLLKPAAVDPFVKAHPEFGALVYVQDTEKHCEFWGVKHVPAAFNQMPSKATVPVMVAAGQFDPVTPPPGTARVAKALGVPLLTFPDSGHGAIGTSRCSSDIWFAFMADPSKAPDTSCMAALKSPTFG